MIKFTNILTLPLLAALFLLGSCRSDSGVDDNITTTTPSTDEEVEEQPAIDYRSDFEELTKAGLYSNGSYLKEYSSSSDQIIYRTDLSEYTITNYIMSVYYHLSISGEVSLGEVVEVTVSAEGVSSVNNTSYSMEVIKSSDDGSLLYLWCDEKSVGAILMIDIE